jgi:NAD(P)H-hydrate epimerase
MRAEIDTDQLYTAAETRELDRLAIEEQGIPGIRLMARAGEACFDLLLERWPDRLPIHIVCGTGNNGGDGYIVAGLARLRGLPCTVYQVGDPARIRGDAQLAREQALADGVEVMAFEPGQTFAGGVLVDALLGTGLSGEVRGDAAAAIDSINASGLPVLAVDIPSGLCSDTGRGLGVTVVADATVTFIGLKRGLFTGRAPAVCGELAFTDLQVPAAVYGTQPASAYRLSLGGLLARLSRRSPDAHKGAFGHVLVIGGDAGMAGAALLAGEAAGRCGAGLVSVATRAASVPAIVARRPELMAHAVESGAGLSALLSRATVLAVGPGLGRSGWSEQLLQRAAESGLPMVLDADGLNLLAESDAIPSERVDNRVLTPHPGEAARLLGVSNAEVQADRFAAVTELQGRYGGAVLLKGAGTLICAGGDVYVSEYGNPGMASGGMGDVLTGVVAALLGQGLDPLGACCLGACLHGRAAELAAAEGERGLLAGDLMNHLRGLLG